MKLKTISDFAESKDAKAFGAAIEARVTGGLDLMQENGLKQTAPTHKGNSL